MHVSQMPPNPNILAPGPALIFVTIDGVPSIGQWVTIGNGQIGQQPTSEVQDLPASSGFSVRTEGDDDSDDSSSSRDSGNRNNASGDDSSSSSKVTASLGALVVLSGLTALAL